MLYYSNQVSRPIFESVTLTDAFAGNRKEFATAGFSKLTVHMDYAMGDAETGNTLDMQLEASHNGTDWYSLVIDNTDTVSTITDRVWQMAAGSRSVLVDIAYQYMRLSVKESGVAANEGTSSVAITLSGL